MPSPTAVLLALVAALAAAACSFGAETVPPPGHYDENGLHVVEHSPRQCSVCKLYADAKGYVVRIQSSSLGAGVVVTPEGLVATNQHVVGKARSVTVQAANGTDYVGRVLATSEELDLALVQLESDDTWPTPQLHDDTPHPVGSDVYVIGHPLGLGWTVTRGIISGYQRLTQGAHGTMIQTDAAVSPGNSGGAMLDANGHLIGIVTSKVDAEGAENLAFARPTQALLDFVRSVDPGAGD